VKPALNRIALHQECPRLLMYRSISGVHCVPRLRFRQRCALDNDCQTFGFGVTATVVLTLTGPNPQKRTWMQHLCAQLCCGVGRADSQGGRLWLAWNLILPAARCPIPANQKLYRAICRDPNLAAWIATFSPQLLLAVIRKRRNLNITPRPGSRRAKSPPR
jgi:hypothetical protein